MARVDRERGWRTHHSQRRANVHDGVANDGTLEIAETRRYQRLHRVIQRDPPLTKGVAE